MKLGASYWATEYATPVTEVAQMVEAAGCESFFVPEHTHIPVASDSTRPTAVTGEAPPELDREYHHMLDPFVALGAVAAVTSSIKIGTAICLIPVRDPIITAKAVATLDQLSGGRVLFGVGAGWLNEELRDHGIDPADRWRLLRENIAAMKAIWTEDEPSFEGSLVSFPKCTCWPKPIQKPYPPILVGMHGPRALKHVVEWGDEWLPGIGQIDDRVIELRQMDEEAGRPPTPVTYISAKVPTPELVDRLEGLGVHRLLFKIPAADREEISQLIDTSVAAVGVVR
jgi:probable F420-dependent oxidoreductase